MPVPGVERLDLVKIGRLDFRAPDTDRFPALALSRQAVKAGPGAPVALNGANEAAVAAFLQRQTGFLSIAKVTGDVLDEFLNTSGAVSAPATFEDVYEIDQWARRRTLEMLRISA